MLRISSSRRRGFTLVELLLVLVILGTLAAIVIPKFAGRSEQARETAARTEVSIIGSAIDQFEVDNGYFPATSDGLDPLMTQPRDAKNWRGPYLKSLPVDPWGNAYVYEYPGKINATGYDLYSMGSDGRAGGGNDVNEKGIME